MNSAAYIAGMDTTEDSGATYAAVKSNITTAAAPVEFSDGDKMAPRSQPVELLDNTERSSNSLLSNCDETIKSTLYLCSACSLAFASVSECLQHNCTRERCTRTSDADVKNNSYRWAECDTATLLSLVSDHAAQLTDSQLKRKYCWLELARLMCQHGHCVTETQCENRWKTLKVMYRKCLRGARQQPFFTSMSSLAAKYPGLFDESVSCQTAGASSAVSDTTATLSTTAALCDETGAHETNAPLKRALVDESDAHSAPAAGDMLATIGGAFGTTTAPPATRGRYEQRRGPADGSTVAKPSTDKPIWSTEATDHFFRVFHEIAPLYERPSVKRYVFWCQFSRRLASRGIHRTPEQCDGKLKTLLFTHGRRCAANTTQCGEFAPPSSVGCVDEHARMCELLRIVPSLSQRSSAGAATTVAPSLGHVATSRRAPRRLAPAPVQAVAGACAAVSPAVVNAVITSSNTVSDSMYDLLSCSHTTISTGMEGQPECSAVDECPVTLSLPRDLPPPPSTVPPALTEHEGVRRQRPLSDQLLEWLEEQRRWDAHVLQVVEQQHAERMRVLTDILAELRGQNALSDECFTLLPPDGAEFTAETE